MSSGPSHTTTTTSTQPWSGQEHYLTPAFAAAAQNYNSGLYSAPAWQTASGQSAVAPMTDAQNQALAGIQARATNGSPVDAAAGGYLSGVLNGDHLNANAPGLQSLMDQIASQVKSQASLNGRYGPNSYTDQAIASGVAAPLFQNYQNERALQQNAAGLAPTLAGQDYADLNALYGAGQQRQQQAQNLLNEQQSVYNYNAAIPANALNTYMGQIGGNYGQSAISTQPYYGPSTGQQVLGGLLGLGGIGLGLAGL